MGSELPATSQASGTHARVNPERRIVRMGKYEVVEHIATGGMGAVYKAFDTESRREVAIKVLPKEMAAKKMMRDRFQLEIRSVAKLRHENIVTLLESGEYNGMLYLVMEYVDGIDLHEHVKKHGPFDPEEARQIVLQGARALRHAEEMGIVHRDIKPSNFLLGRKNGRVHIKLLDFGLARDIDSEEYAVTKAGTTVGTIDYMSPEQARNSRAADIRSDLYSLGSTWYHLLSGQSPFPEGGLGERLLKIMHEEPTDLRYLNPRVSEENWRVIRKLLAKDPAQRYQTCNELIDDLLTLEGKTTASPRSRSTKTALKKTRTRRTVSSARAETVLEPQPQSNKLWYVLAAVAACLLLGGMLVALSMPRRPVKTEDQPEVFSPSILPEPPASVGTQERVLSTPTPVPGQQVHPSEVGSSTSEDRSLPLVAASVRAVDVQALREEIERPWQDVPAVPSEALTVQVSRASEESPLRFRSLAEASQAGEPGKPLIIEIHDNGPLYERGMLTCQGRDLVIRAGKGYRPLLVWDLQGWTTGPARSPEQPLHFLAAHNGRLLLEGVELAWKWPETLRPSAAIFKMTNGDFQARDCTFSGAGKTPQELTLLRVHSTREGVRSRLTRCQIRGQSLTALYLDAPGAEVLFEGCLLVGGQRPLLRVHAGSKAPRMRVVRSTLVSGPTLLELQPQDNEPSPALAWLGWDSLFSRPDPTIGTLFALQGGADTRQVQWRAINCLYSGWKQLLTASNSIPLDAASWRRHWLGGNSEGLVRDPWPEQMSHEPATQPARFYQPTQAVAFASTLDRNKPLGCDLTALPASRNNWLTLALEPALVVPDLPVEDSLPSIPPAEEGKYTGGVIAAGAFDLGAELARLQAANRLGPRVVLSLTGKGEHLTSPIRLKGVSLVLHFEEPADENASRLILTQARTSSPVPLIDLQDGNLEVIGGTLRVPDQANHHASQVIRVRGGDVRLYRTRIEGPQQSVPEGYVAAISLGGSGEAAPEKGRNCAIHESMILSSKAAIVLEGVGCRLAMKQSLVVSGSDALYLLPGPKCTGKTGMHVGLTQVTIASRRAVVYLGDAPSAGVPEEPVVVRTQQCVYLNPFPGRLHRAGLLLWEGQALPRGLLVWQSERDGFDNRLHFAAARLGDISDKKEGYTPWKQLWGSLGMRQPRDLGVLPVFEPRRWALERLVVKMREAPGVNLERLGISARRPR